MFVLMAMSVLDPIAIKQQIDCKKLLHIKLFIVCHMFSFFFFALICLVSLI